MRKSYVIRNETEATFICGRKTVMERLAEPGIEVQEQLWAVLAEDEAMKGTDTPKPLRAEVKHILWQVLTLEAWELLTHGRS